MFFSIPNLTSAQVTQVPEPWSLVTSRPEFESKQQFRTWCMATTTDHQFLSGFEGLHPGRRASYDMDNPPTRMHGFIADYDARISDALIEDIKAHPPQAVSPAYFTRTFSGNGRLIWLFEKPIRFATKDQTKRFLVALSKKLLLKKWLPGLDEKFGDPCMYYEIGNTPWIPINPASVIPQNYLELWLYEVSKTAILAEGKLADIPMEDVAAEVERRWPGRWKGTFAEGQRGVRFWDDTAEDPTGAVVMKHGMMAFSGEQAFLPWSVLLGKEFMQKYEADRFGKIRSVSAYDGKYFYVEMEKDVWKEYSKDDFSQYLRTQGFDPRRGRGETCSEVDRVEVEIKTNKRVEVAGKFIHYKPGLMYYNNQLCLNTASYHVLSPAPSIGTDKATLMHYMDSCPFIFKLLRHLFPPPQQYAEYSQLEHFLGWLKFFYENALNQSPRSGQCIVLVGPVNSGKTFFATKVIAGLVGSVVDATHYLVQGSQFSDAALGSPIMLIDDSMAGTDARLRAHFDNQIKKLVANGSAIHNAKFHSAKQVPWHGRIIINANSDLESLRILPDMDINNKDKVSLFKASDKAMIFPSWAECDRIIASELPIFARFLLDWPLPPHIMDGRFGVKSYHHPDLYTESLYNGRAGLIYELLHSYIPQYATLHPNETMWRGTTSQMFHELQIHNEAVLRGMTPTLLSIGLANLSKRGYPIRKGSEKNHRYWEIDYELISSSLETDLRNIMVEEGVTGSSRDRVNVDLPGSAQASADDSEVPQTPALFMGGEGFEPKLARLKGGEIDYGKEDQKIQKDVQEMLTKVGAVADRVQETDDVDDTTDMEDGE